MTKNDAQFQAARRETGLDHVVAARRFLTVTRQAEGMLSLQRPLAEHVAVWGNLLRALARHSGRSVLIDSSKTSRLTWYRSNLLRRTPGLRVDVLHLVRDPRAVMWSFRRGDNQKLERGEPSRKAGRALRGLAGWTFSNLRAAREDPFAVLRYEDLVARGAIEVGAILERFGLDPLPVVEILREEGGVVSGHGVAGNRMRRAGPIHLRADREWETKLSRPHRLLAGLARPMARKYAYFGGENQPLPPYGE